MLKKGLKLNSILTGTCPKCQEESMYVDKNMYNPSSTIKMKEQCSHCGLHYKIEPSFFYGSMYVSYGLGVALGVAAFVVFYFIIKTNIKVAFIGIATSLILLMPIIMRLSRNIWINIFVGFDKNWKENKR